MNNCPRCQVSVDDKHHCCPLCQRVLYHKDKASKEADSELSETQQSYRSYPSYQHLYRPIKHFTVKNILLFLMVSIIVVSVIVNLMTLQRVSFTWSLLTAAALLYVWGTVNNTVLSKMRIGGKVLLQFVFLSLFLFVIDLHTNFFRWSVNYAIPALAVGTTLFITIVALRKKDLWYDYFGFLMATLLISLVPLALFILKVSTVAWPGTVSAIYSFLTVFALYIFSDKDFKREIKKRFHY